MRRVPGAKLRAIAKGAGGKATVQEAISAREEAILKETLRTLLRQSRPDELDALRIMKGEPLLLVRRSASSGELASGSAPTHISPSTFGPLVKGKSTRSELPSAEVWAALNKSITVVPLKLSTQISIEYVFFPQSRSHLA